MSKGLQIAIGAALVACLLGWYGMSQVSEGGFAYYQTLAEFRAGGEPGEAARVHGFVVPGSIERDVEAKQVSLRLGTAECEFGDDDLDALKDLLGRAASGK